MNILHISYYDNNGGAAKAAFRLHKALLKLNIDSKILVTEKTTIDRSIITVFNSPIAKIINLSLQSLNNLIIKKYKKDEYITWSTNMFSSGMVIKKIKEINPDLVHIHWIGNSMLSISELSKITVPVVYTFHDSWYFTGGCHVPNDCTKYKDNCNKCPQLNSNKKFDASHFIYNKKITQWGNINFNIITPSKWLSSCTKKSRLFKNANIHTIHQGLDIQIFRPIQKSVAREILQLNQTSKIILFGAVSATKDKNKGFDLLINAISNLPSQNNYTIAIFGSNGDEIEINAPFPIKFLGKLYDETSMSLLYSACDVMVVPSYQESFGQTAIESMACGTPVVAFGATGLLDIIDHRVNGFLAKPYDSESLADGISWILENVDYNTLSENARNKVVNTFDIKNIAEKYISIYNDIFFNSKIERK